MLDFFVCLHSRGFKYSFMMKYVYTYLKIDSQNLGNLNVCNLKLHKSHVKSREYNCGQGREFPSQF